MVLSLCWGEIKVRRRRDVVVLHSSVLLGVFITAAHHFYCSVLQTLGRDVVWEGAHQCGSQPGRIFSGLNADPCPLPRLEVNLQFAFLGCCKFINDVSQNSTPSGVFEAMFQGILILPTPPACCSHGISTLTSWPSIWLLSV